MKRRKLSVDPPLPVDCVGEILSFICSTKIFFKAYTLSKHVKWYIDEECASISCKHIRFIAARDGLDVTSEKKYVVHLTLNRDIHLRFFPRVKSLIIAKIVCQKIAQYYEYLPNLKNLQLFAFTGRFEVLDGHLKDSEMNCFSNLKEINIGRVGRNLSDEGLKHLTNVENLSIYECHLVSGECFKSMLNLRELDIWLDFSKKREFFKYLGKLRKLNVSLCSDLQDSDFKYFSSSKLESIKMMCTRGLTDACLQYIPKELTEIESNGNGISANALSRFRDLVSVIDPPNGFDFSQFKKVRKYEILGNVEIVHDFFSSIHVIPTNLEELTLNPLRGGIVSDDRLVLLKKFSNLKVLKLYYCYEITSAGMKTIAENHKLKMFKITYNDNITQNDLDLIRAVEKTTKGCDNIGLIEIKIK